jgi:hypothetical protein
MSTRISDRRVVALLVPGLVLAACSGPPQQTANAQAPAPVAADQRHAAEDDERILCARGTAPLARRCTVDRAQTDRGLVLTLRAEDGGFHRLLVTRNGRGVVAADGAEPATVTVRGADGIEVAIGADHYQLPATVKR